MIVSCSGRKTSVRIEQYTDPTYVTGIAVYQDFLFCATKGGLVRWNQERKDFTIFTTADGLPSNILTDIVVDGKERLWVSSREGIGMYENDTWKTFGIADGLPSTDIADLSVDNDGILWVATADGAARFERGKFKLLAEKGSPGRMKIACIYFDRGNNLWLGTEGRGIFMKLKGEWNVTNTRNGLTANGATVITQAWDLRMWAGSWVGISSWDGIGWNMYQSLEEMGAVEARYMTSTNQRTWYFTTNGVHSSHGDDWEHFTKDKGLLSNDVTAGYVVSDELIYVGTSEGCSVIDHGSIENYVIPNRPIGSNFISIVFDDRGRGWIGTWETGPCLYDSGYWTSLSGEGSANLKTVRSTVFSPDGGIFFNTAAGIVFYKDRTWKTYTRDNGLSGDDVRCGIYDRKGWYWVGTATGICTFKDGVWKRYRSIHGLPSEDAWACGIDSTGTVWFATTGGIVSFADNNTLLDWTPETGLESVDARSLHIRDSKVYIGTSAGNLLVYDGKQWDVYSNRFLKTEKTILTITSEPSGALWLGTDGDGIIYVGDGRTTKYDMSDGLPSNFVRALDYHDGKIWAACYGGLATLEYAPGVK